jgi:hypothetical protein
VATYVAGALLHNETRLSSIWSATRILPAQRPAFLARLWQASVTTALTATAGFGYAQNGILDGKAHAAKAWRCRFRITPPPADCYVVAVTLALDAYQIAGTPIQPCHLFTAKPIDKWGRTHEFILPDALPYVPGQWFGFDPTPYNSLGTTAIPDGTYFFYYTFVAIRYYYGKRDVYWKPL